MQCRASHIPVVLLFQSGEWCLCGSSDHHTLRAVPPGPHAINLAEVVQAHHQVWHHTGSQVDPCCGLTLLSTVRKQSVLPWRQTEAALAAVTLNEAHHKDQKLGLLMATV